MAKKSRFFRRHRKKWSKIKKYFGFFLVSYIPIQKKKCTSEQFLQGRPTVHIYLFAHCLMNDKNMK